MEPLGMFFCVICGMSLIVGSVCLIIFVADNRKAIKELTDELGMEFKRGDEQILKHKEDRKANSLEEEKDE